MSICRVRAWPAGQARRARTATRSISRRNGIERLMRPFCVRLAQPADIPALMRLKRALAQSENSLHAVRASPADWLRDGFGPQAGFTAFVAEGRKPEGILGMATCSPRVITGWNGPVI